jgi:flagellin
MSVINTNVNAVLAQNSLIKNERAMSTAMEQLSTGKRINSAADDAAGLAIASKMTAQIRGLDQAVRNINDAVSMIQTAEGTTNEITNMLQRMRELAVQTSSGTNTTADQTNIELEFQALLVGIDNIADTTQWNGTNILDGTGVATVFQIGANNGQTLTVDLGNLQTDAFAAAVTTAVSAVSAVAGSAGVNTVTTTSAQAVLMTSFVAGSVTVSMTAGTVTTVSSLATYLNTQTAFAASYTAVATSSAIMTITENSGAYTAAGPTVSTVGTTTAATTYSIATGVATVTAVTAVATSSAVLGLGADISALTSTTASVLTTLDTALAAVSTQQAIHGAAINQLEHTADSLSNVSLNTQASRSRIEDADYAKATTELARTQIIQQAGTAMLAQANQQAQGVLALLQ